MPEPAFAKVPIEAFGDITLTLRELRVLGVLCAYANARGVCWPSRDQIAVLSALPPKRVSEATSKLARCGWIRRGWKNGHRVYFIRLCGGGGPGVFPIPEPGTSGVPKTGEGPQSGDGPRTGDAEVPSLGTSGVPESGTSGVPDLGTLTDHRTDQGTDQEQTNGASAAPSALTTGRDRVGTGTGLPASPALPSPDPRPAGKGTRRKRPPAALGPTQQARFDRFWSVWPKRVAKGEALRAWATLAPDEALTERIVTAVTLARQAPGWRRDGGQFIPHPATWLRRLGWEDEFTVDVEPLPPPEPTGARGRMDATVHALQSLFGDDDGPADIPTGDGLPGGGLRDGDHPREGGGVLGPAGRAAR